MISRAPFAIDIIVLRLYFRAFEHFAFQVLFLLHVHISFVIVRVVFCLFGCNISIIFEMNILFTQEMKKNKFIDSIRRNRYYKPQACVPLVSTMADFFLCSWMFTAESIEYSTGQRILLCSQTIAIGQRLGSFHSYSYASNACSRKLTFTSLHSLIYCLDKSN